MGILKRVDVTVIKASDNEAPDELRTRVFVYLFAKQDRANIDDDELADFRKLAQAFGRMTDTELRAALNQGDLLELCDEE